VQPAILDFAALLLGLTALFGWLNRRSIRMPPTIGLLLMGFSATLLPVLLDRIFPQEALEDRVRALLGRIDFTATVLDGVLALLLFAGGLQTTRRRAGRMDPCG
jgi:CPA1 family monovalent cation:H+ antiporter